MPTKAERTKNFIIDKVAPIFNKKGYADTSLSDITFSTGLTKGSVYGNFKNKEELALAAFNYNLRKIMRPLADRINTKKTPNEKLEEIFKYYKQYYSKTIEFGGCPILNIGIDANHQNSLLQLRVKEVIKRLINNIQEIIAAGKTTKVFKKNIDEVKYAKRIYSMIEGSIFTAMMQNDEIHIKDMMDYLQEMTKRELLS